MGALPLWLTYVVLVAFARRCGGGSDHLCGVSLRVGQRAPNRYDPTWLLLLRSSFAPMAALPSFPHYFPTPSPPLPSSPLSSPFACHPASAEELESETGVPEELRLAARSISYSVDDLVRSCARKLQTGDVGHLAIVADGVVATFCDALGLIRPSTPDRMTRLTTVTRDVHHGMTRLLTAVQSQHGPAVAAVATTLNRAADQLHATIAEIGGPGVAVAADVVDLAAATATTATGLGANIADAEARQSFLNNMQVGAEKVEGKGVARLLRCVALHVPTQRGHVHARTLPTHTSTRRCLPALRRYLDRPRWWRPRPISVTRRRRRPRRRKARGRHCGRSTRPSPRWRPRAQIARASRGPPRS